MADGRNGRRYFGVDGVESSPFRFHKAADDSAAAPRSTCTAHPCLVVGLETVLDPPPDPSPHGEG